jgi:2,4-dienoyl-CoA reductase-like NADH-dependent reductase (Old Yellow Enzyme family)
MSRTDVPRELAVAEIKEHAQLQYTPRLRETPMEAGFDGVELHGANGFLLDQFLQSVPNSPDG